MSAKFNEDKELDLVPSLRQVVEAEGLNPEKLSVGLPSVEGAKPKIEDRHLIFLCADDKGAPWHVPSLRELYRGNKQPPPDMDHYPEEYTLCFYIIEQHVLTIAEAIGDPTDQELHEIYSSLRRRPDGRSLGLLHDYIWQAAALCLGCFPLSEAEYQGMISALEISTHKWSVRPVSRFYIDYLRRNL